MATIPSDASASFDHQTTLSIWHCRVAALTVPLRGVCSIGSLRNRGYGSMVFPARRLAR